MWESYSEWCWMMLNDGVWCLYMTRFSCQCYSDSTSVASSRAASTFSGVSSNSSHLILFMDHFSPSGPPQLPRRSGWSPSRRPCDSSQPFLQDLPFPFCSSWAHCPHFLPWCECACEYAEKGSSLLIIPLIFASSLPTSLGHLTSIALDRRSKLISTRLTWAVLARAAGRWVFVPISLLSPRNSFLGNTIGRIWNTFWRKWVTRYEELMGRRRLPRGLESSLTTLMTKRWKMTTTGRIWTWIWTESTVYSVIKCHTHLIHCHT